MTASLVIWVSAPSLLEAATRRWPRPRNFEAVDLCDMVMKRSDIGESMRKCGANYQLRIERRLDGKRTSDISINGIIPGAYVRCPCGVRRVWE